MPARITIKAELQNLLNKAQALTDANRLSQLEGERRRRAEREQLAAKKVKAEEEERRRRALDDPTMRNIRTAAMGQQGRGTFGEAFPGYFGFVYSEQSRTLTYKVRSGIGVTDASGYFEDIVNGDYANGIDTQTIVFDAPPEGTGLPVRDDLLAEIFADPYDGGSGWIPGSFFGFSGNQNYVYVIPFGPEANQIVWLRYVDFSTITVTGGESTSERKEYGFTTTTGFGGAPLPVGFMEYYVGARISQEVASGSYGGFITNTYREYDEFFSLISETPEPITVTGTIPGYTINTEYHWGWRIAMTRRAPAAQSVSFVGSAGSVEALLNGDYSSYPGFGGGSMLERSLRPIDGGGGGGGGGGENS